MRSVRAMAMVVGAGLALGLAARADAAPEEGAPAVRVAGERTSYVIEMEAPVGVGKLLEEVVRTTNLRLRYDPNDKRIQHEVLGGSRVRLAGSADDVLAQLRRELFAVDLVVLGMGPEGQRTWAILDRKSAAGLTNLSAEHVTIDAGSVEALRGQVGRFVSAWIPVEHLQDLRGPRTALQRLVTQGNLGNITEVPDGPGFLVTDFAPNVAAVFQLLSAMDRVASANTATAGITTTVSVRYGNAVELAALLREHFGQPEAAVQAGRPAPATGSEPRAPRISADARTNRLLVTGSASDVEAVRAAVALLDIELPAPQAAPAAPSRGPAAVIVVHLEHAVAEEAAQRLLQLVAQSRDTWGRTQRPAIVADPRTNSLLLSAEAAALERLRDLVGALDVPASDR